MKPPAGLLISVSLLILFFVSGCENRVKNREAGNQRDSTSQQLTLILIRPSESVRMKDATGHIVGMGRPGEELSIIDDHHLVQPIKIKYAPENDTVVIKLKRRFIQVNFVYKVFDQYNFFFHNGDSVIIEYDQGYPSPRVINRKVRPWDMRYEQYIKDSVYKQDCPSLFKLTYMPFFTNEAAKESALKERFTKTAHEEMIKASHLLDSLHELELISAEQYAFYRQRNTFWQEILRMDGKAHYLRPEWTKTDTLLGNHFFVNYVMSTVSTNITQSVSSITVANGKIKDYREVLDRLIINKELMPAERDMMLYVYMGRIIENFPAKEVGKLFKKFASAVHDQHLVTQLIKKYHLDFESAEQLHLRSIGNELLSLHELLKQNKGKLIYVDIWASWCAPCIASFPASSKLREEYENKGVVFLYLSEDDDWETWKRSSVKFKLPDTKSYFIVNRFASPVLDSLEIKSIPSYLLYDAMGKLLNKNAPDPGEDKIRKLFDRYLQVK